MTLTAELQRKLIEAVACCMIEHADELVALDQAIGDGDHGLNMKRGFEAVLADLDKIAALPTGEALKAVGMTLVMKELILFPMLLKPIHLLQNYIWRKMTSLMKGQYLWQIP